VWEPTLPLRITHSTSTGPQQWPQQLVAADGHFF
jgi:hypothetical protein